MDSLILSFFWNHHHRKSPPRRLLNPKLSTSGRRNFGNPQTYHHSSILNQNTCPSQLLILCGLLAQATLSNCRRLSSKLNFFQDVLEVTVSSFLKHFYKDLDGSCTICQDNCEGSVEHLLVVCSALAESRQQQLRGLSERNDISDTSKSLIRTISEKSNEDFVQLLLDCSVIPEVITASQTDTSILSEIFKFSRTWCFNMHMKRLKLLGRWKNSFYIG